MKQLEIVDAPCCAVTDGALIAADRARHLAESFKALSDPTRVRLLRHIAGSEDATACACHLPDLLGISQPTLSHHMQKLVRAGLVDREQRGRWAHYTVRPGAIDALRTFLDDAV